MSSDIKKKLEQSNRAKYGDKEFDQISQAYRVSKEKGDIWCSENVKRYLDRFTRPGSTKSNNFTDLLKAKDYLERMIEENKKQDFLKKNVTEEVIENFSNGKN
jgi:hypothetical protein